MTPTPFSRKPRDPNSPAAKGFAKAKAKYGKPKKKLRKVSKRPLRLLVIKADRSMQDFYRHLWPNSKCEICGGMSYAMHHFVPKSQSAMLRYDLSNLVWICKGCHTRHHLAGDPIIHGTIIKARGPAWYNYIETMRKRPLKLDRQFVEKQIERFQ